MSDRKPAGMSRAEWEARLDLAAAHRLMDHFGVRDLTYNHLSARVPDAPDMLLIKAPDMMFGEITASNLGKFRLDGTGVDEPGKKLGGGALVIHAGLLARRPLLHAVFHTHTAANMAVSCHARGLLPLTQQAMLFHGRLAYHEFGGFEFEPGMEDVLDRDLGSHPAALLRNHGCLVVGETVAEAFVAHHFLEMACQAQVGALAGGEVTMPKPEAVAHGAAQMQALEPTKNGGKNWAACRRLADRLYPDYAT